MMYGCMKEVHVGVLFQYKKYALNYSMQSPPSFVHLNFQSFGEHLKAALNFFFL